MPVPRWIATAALAACGGVGANPISTASFPQTGVPVSVQPVASESSSGIRDRQRLVIRSEAEWADLWGRMRSSHALASRVPAVDFTRDMLLVASMGTRGTGGFDIAIPQASLDGGKVYAVVVETSPGKGCVTTQAVTTPAVVVRVPRSEAPVVFAESTAVHDCD